MKKIEQIDDFENRHKLVIPTQYKDFLKNKNGVSFAGGTILYSLDELKQMNDDLQVQKYKHDYLAIGDDGGGIVFLMKQALNAEEVICVDMSDYDIESPFCKIESFSEWYKNGCNICIKKQEDDNKLGQEGDVFLVKTPNNGMKDLIKIKQVFNMDIPLSQLVALSKELPCMLIKDIKYVKAIKLMEGVGQLDIFEFRGNGD
ncbi:MAG: hypothetical protein HDR17_12935 [Lachnospiraceae bacterium]|nr:hypothetical protein [Lachnospiraceae bacterium]